VALIVTTLVPQKGGGPPFLQNTVASHQKSLRGELPLEKVNSNPQVISEWLFEQIGVEPYFPNFDDENVVLLGGRIIDYKGQEVGLISYQVHDVPVTLVVAKKTALTEIETSDHTYVGERRINFAKADGFNVVSWSVCTNNFALISTLPRQGKQGCMTCHANGSGLIDLSEFYTQT
jgi:anti-sigma factor RsiW